LHLTIAGGLLGQRHHLEAGRYQIETTGFLARLSVSGVTGLGRPLEGRDRLQPRLD
jgi:hypothetical protein